MAIDYEAEYDNRARVPEHPQIFARWQRDAAAFRAAMADDERAELGLAYGPSARRTLDLFFPDAMGKGPLALFVHGGYWRALEPSTFSHMAAGLGERGVAVAVAGYDLCPKVSVADIVAEIRAACVYLWKRFGQRIMVYGHSAGGHLAATTLATDWKSLDPGAPHDLVPTAYSISGLFDLAPLVGISMNQDLRLGPDDARKVSPVHWPAPVGRALDSVVGALESAEFLRQAALIVDTWGPRGVDTRYEAITGANHFTVIEPLTDPKSPMVARLTELADRTLA